jgi:WD40 repeat protein
MSEAFEYDVFISHSSADKPAVRELARRLRADGLRVWFDEWEIKPGDMISLKVEQGLQQSRTLILVMSAAAFASEWVTLERHTALFRDPTNAQRRFIPLRLDDAEINDALKQLAYVDWRERADEQYTKLLAACRPEKATDRPQTKDKRVVGKEKVLKGHTDEVNCVAVTSDGKRAVSGSSDNTLKVWDLESGRCLATLGPHFRSVMGSIMGVAVTPDAREVVSALEGGNIRVWNLESGERARLNAGSAAWGVRVTPDGKRIVSGSREGLLKVWDLGSGEHLADLKGHKDSVGAWSIAITPDGKKVVSGSWDGILKVWDMESYECLATFEGHAGNVFGAEITPDGKKVVSGSKDGTLKVWDMESGRCIATFEGHAGWVYGVAVTPDGRRAVSASEDKTVRVWDLGTGKCIDILEGHTLPVYDVAVTPDGRRAVSASIDTTVRVWDLPAYDEKQIEESEVARYTNAKVVLVGETGVGKTGLALRLCEDRWDSTESTHGMLVSQLRLPLGDARGDMEREVWLWDFAGQPDYRLVHQLYMDETALGVLVFDPQDDNPFEDLGHWEKALHAATRYEPAKLLVAARCDRGGITISKRRFQQYCGEHDFAGFLSTGARTGEGCEELKAAIARHIPWDRLPWTATTRLFKTLKDAVLKLTDEDAPLVRLPELRQRLQLMLPEETISVEELRAVVGLMQGQGVARMLDFGDFVLLQPEQINRYASVVVRMAREHVDEMGTVPEQ